MNADFADVKYKDIAEKTIGAFYKVYEYTLCKELQKSDIQFESQVPIKVFYDSEPAGDYFADVLVDDKVRA